MRSVTAILTIAFLCAARFVAAEEDLMVKSVLDRFTTAIGGKDAWNKIETRKSIGQMEMTNSIPSEWTLEAKIPNKRFTRSTFPKIGVIVTGFDGTNSWSKSRTGIRGSELRGEELVEEQKEADFRREVRLLELYPNLQFNGTEMFNGEEVQVLETDVPMQAKFRFSFSTKSGLLVREQTEYKGLYKEAVLSDYRDVDHVKYPHFRRFKFLQGEQLVFDIMVNVKQIKHNENIQDKQFTRPTE